MFVPSPTSSVFAEPIRRQCSQCNLTTCGSALQRWEEMAAAPTRMKEVTVRVEDRDITVPQPRSMQELITLLHGVMGPTGGLDETTTPWVRALMSAYTSRESDWERYVHLAPNKYTRNLVDDGNGKFNLMILAWGQGQGSKVHDHAGAHCVMKILDGSLEEIQYGWPTHEEGSDPSLPVLSNQLHGRDQITYIHDRIGLHRVANPSHERPAISLHLYTPPYEECHVFDESSGKAQPTGRQGFHSKGGKVCE